MFPSGTSGLLLDAFARAPLWRDGLVYGHGTGHGIGAFVINVLTLLVPRSQVCWMHEERTRHRCARADILGGVCLSKAKPFVNHPTLLCLSCLFLRSLPQRARGKDDGNLTFRAKTTPACGRPAFGGLKTPQPHCWRRLPERARGPDRHRRRHGDGRRDPQEPAHARILPGANRGRWARRCLFVDSSYFEVAR